MEKKIKVTKEMSLDHIREVLKVMKEEGVIAFTYKDLSVNFTNDAVDNAKKIESSTVTLDKNVPNEETEEQRLDRTKAEENDILYGST